MEEFTLTTTDACTTMTNGILEINQMQFFIELPDGAIPGGPELISEGQTMGIPYVDTLIHSLHTPFPLCTGALTLLPDPRVVVLANTYSSLPVTTCDPNDCPLFVQPCGDIFWYANHTTQILPGGNEFVDSKTVVTALTPASGGGGAQATSSLAASQGATPAQPASQTSERSISGLETFHIIPPPSASPADTAATTIAYTAPTASGTTTAQFTSPAVGGDTTIQVTQGTSQSSVNVVPALPEDASATSAQSTQGTSPDQPAAGNTPAASQTVTFAVGTATFTANSAGVSVGSTFVTPGGQAVTTGSVVISVNSGGVVVSSLTSTNAAQSAPNIGSYIASGIGLPQASTATPAVTTYAFNSQPAASGAVVSIGSGGASTLSLSNGNLVVGSQTITSGGSAATVNGKTYSVGSNGVVVGGSTYAVSALPSSTPSGAVITIGGSTYTASATGSSALVIDSQTISAGGPAATVNSQVVSLGSSGVVVGSSTVAISALGSPSSTISGAIFTISGSAFTDIANAPVTIGTTTLSVGGPAATVNGEVISAASSGIVIAGSTQSFSAIPSPSPASQAVFTIGSNVYTETAGSDLVIGSTTLSPGGPAATVGGTVVSLASNGVAIAPASSTSNSVITTISTYRPHTTSGAVFAIDHSTFTEIEGSSLVIGSYTLSAGGPAITIGGEYISVGSSGIVLGSSTVPYSALPSGTVIGKASEGLIARPKVWSLGMGVIGVIVWFAI